MNNRLTAIVFVYEDGETKEVPLELQKQLGYRLVVSKSGRTYKNYYKRTKQTSLRNIRSEVHHRANDVCENCGTSRGRLHIHHLNGSEFRQEPHPFTSENENNKVENLKLLCSSCHQKLHRLHLEFMERTKPIVLRRETGETFESIGKDLGLSRQRIHQIYKKAKKAK